MHKLRKSIFIWRFLLVLCLKHRKLSRTLVLLTFKQAWTCTRARSQRSECRWVWGFMPLVLKHGMTRTYKTDQIFKIQYHPKWATEPIKPAGNDRCQDNNLFPHRLLQEVTLQLSPPAGVQTVYTFKTLLQWLNFSKQETTLLEWG